ncbi:cysteine dioxygenase family protein [Rhodococcus sp. G-MC3]|uniref:cysteine dioxygenase n=1 Tax=Rhodococcus sp. G-MC3 TaxID=3046209 RepID=UPI0024B8AD44|nr:cysteine dioxygenase family protein [Rhodococcus sp. G-MC3]MDJ0393427.1 cysteine dioxygenase family protein [Rhodococcus sp. G-MC3]
MLSTPVFSGSALSGSRTIASQALPTRLRPHDLLRITDQGASEVLEGCFDHLLPGGGIWPTEERWSIRLHTDDDIDVWLISWVPDRSTELHDHAGSLGALTVLSGSLVEYRWAGDGLKRRRLDAGDQASFPLGWVHDVMRAPASISTGPTLSVHAYSPPLTAMSYYEVKDKTALRRTRTELTDLPEGPHAEGQSESNPKGFRA